MPLSKSTQLVLGITIGCYLVGIYAIGWLANRRIHSTEDFIVAGRRLPLSLAWLTLLATWFGAGTLLTAADEVRHHGLQAAGLDPIGAGCCLLFVGLFVARPMWRMKLLTVPDFFRRRFGRGAEIVSALILVPSYFGWIAVQFIALAEMLHLLFELPVAHGIWIVAVVGCGYTLLGGMWSVTLTDAVQIVAVIVGLVILSFATFSELGNDNVLRGWTRLRTETPDEHWIIVPTSDYVAFFGWLGLFLTGALGNVPVQDLMQRVFAANCERTAQRACWIAGIAYLTFGILPVFLGLAGNLLVPESVNAAILPAMARATLGPAMLVVFVVTLLSAVLSTIDSAILSPASVLAQNVFPRFGQRPTLATNRIAVGLVTIGALGVAYLGENAYSLLADAYAMTLVGLFVPLMAGLYTESKSGAIEGELLEPSSARTPSDQCAAVAAMSVGVGIWAAHLTLGWDQFLEPVLSPQQWPVPISLTATIGAAISYGCGLVVTRVDPSDDE